MRAKRLDVGKVFQRIFRLNSSYSLEQLTELSRRAEDRRPDLADLCVIRMSELYPRHMLITVDESDFRVYRRNKREAIPHRRQGRFGWASYASGWHL